MQMSTSYCLTDMKFSQTVKYYILENLIDSIDNVIK